MTHTPRDAHRETDRLNLAPEAVEGSELKLGVFRRFEEADSAIAALVKDGVTKERLSLVCSDELPELSVDASGDIERVEGAIGDRRLPAVLTGGALGTLIGGLGMTAGLAASGGAGLLFFGPILGGAALGLSGGFVGAMVARGLEPDAADFYDAELRAGRILVAVEPPTEKGQPSSARAEDILTRHGARTNALSA